VTDNCITADETERDNSSICCTYINIYSGYRTGKSSTGKKEATKNTTKQCAGCYRRRQTTRSVFVAVAAKDCRMATNHNKAAVFGQSDSQSRYHVVILVCSSSTPNVGVSFKRASQLLTYINLLTAFALTARLSCFSSCFISSRHSATYLDYRHTPDGNIIE